jgi:hypothetical protein
MHSEWKPPATVRRTARLTPCSRAAASTASSASFSPDSTIWPGALRFATWQMPCAAPTAARARAWSSSAPIRLVMPLGSPRSPLHGLAAQAHEAQRVVELERAGAPQRAVLASERPATKAPASVSRPRARSTPTIAALVARMPGCATSVRCTASPPSDRGVSREKPSTWSARSNTARASGKAAHQSRPMPRNCAPWPGKRIALRQPALPADQSAAPGQPGAEGHEDHELALLDAPERTASSKATGTVAAEVLA